MQLNPYESPQTVVETRRRPFRIASKVGTAILMMGLAALAYGATGFWIVPSLPPNNGWTGRLPSLYVMGAGIAAALIGLTITSFQAPAGKKGAVPTGLGFLLIVGVVVAFAVAVRRFK